MLDKYLSIQMMYIDVMIQDYIIFRRVAEKSFIYAVYIYYDSIWCAHLFSVGRF